jgi:ribose 5-phosphate isomerase B
VKIAIAADHAGYRAKEKLKDLLGKLGHGWEDFGTDGEESVDYPDHAAPAARAVSEGRCHAGILICGTGLGVAMVANKIRGIRAATCHDAMTAEMSRRHNDANVLCMGARVLDWDAMETVARTWLSTAFEGGRHARRVDKIRALDPR